MPTYSGFTKTLYPGEIDERNANSNFRVNINFGERTSATDPRDYYVLADDVNCLQEAIIAIERSLGVMPQGENMSSSVAERLQNIENFILKDASAMDGFTNLDERYMWGGTKPSGLDSSVKLSIKYHLHDGTSSGADKIDLVNHVTGKLKKSNIDLTSGTQDMLTAQDIMLSTTSEKSVAERFTEKYDVTGGPINGPVSIAGAASSRFFIELDVAETNLTGTVGINVTDSKAESGVARRALSSGSSGKLFEHSHKLRYGDYVACFRVKVDSNTSTNNICKFYITDGYKETSLTVTPKMFTTANEYDMVYLEFRHQNNHGTSSRPALKIGAHFYNGITNLNIDSVVVLPIHTAVYDNDAATLY
jgi:hypothetical protein